MRRVEMRRLGFSIFALAVVSACAVWGGNEPPGSRSDTGETSTERMFEPVEGATEEKALRDHATAHDDPRSPWAWLPRPAAVPSGGVRWQPEDVRPAGFAGESSEVLWPTGSGADRDLPDSVRMRKWRALAGTKRLRSFALRRLAPLHLAAGDTLVADSCWRELAATPSIWQWEALRWRADLAVARGGLPRADSILEAADRTGWPDAERAAWLLRRAELRTEIGDSARALEFFRQIVRRYPSVGAARPAVGRLETMVGARGEKLSPAEETAAAEVEMSLADRAAATRRLERAFAGEHPDRVRNGLRLAAVLRERRHFARGLEVLDAVERAATSEGERARALLERARIHRDAGRATSAYESYAEAARLAGDTALRETAWWECGQEAERRGDWVRARHAYGAAADPGGPRADAARLRHGLLWLADGERDSARVAWRAGESEALEFWRAVVSRGIDPGADSALARVATRPGYRFYRAAARETLGFPGWPGVVAADACGYETRSSAPGPACEALALAHDLIAIGASEDAIEVLRRWRMEDARLTGSASGSPVRDPARLLLAARLAYAAGHYPLGIQLARTATQAAEEEPGDRSWGVVVWAYPPAFDTLYMRLPAVVGDGAERALVQAMTWQESKFDPLARSRSNALGLLQLKLPTARDVAGWLREPAPDERALFDAERSLRYAVRYLRWLLGRFDGHIAVALAAYNAGPGRIPPRWRELRERGGDALLCELHAFEETRDYVKTILGVRQAYRELLPARVENPR